MHDPSSIILCFNYTEWSCINKPLRTIDFTLDETLQYKAAVTKSVDVRGFLPMLS